MSISVVLIFSFLNPASTRWGTCVSWKKQNPEDPIKESHHEALAIPKNPVLKYITSNIFSMLSYLFFSSSPQEVRLQYVSTPPGFSSLLA